MSIPELSKQELEKPRTQSELRTWLDEVYARFGETKEGKQAVRRAKRKCIKELNEELTPLARLADRFYPDRDDVLFKPMIGNQSHDAEIICASTKKTIQSIEITQAYDPNSHYRREHLADHGHAPQTGRFIRDHVGRVVPAGDRGVRSGQLQKSVCDWVAEAVCRKTNRTYSSGTALIVAIEEWLMRNDRDREKLDEFVQAQVLSSSLPFEDLYLLGIEPAITLHYKQEKETRTWVAINEFTLP